MGILSMIYLVDDSSIITVIRFGFWKMRMYDEQDEDYSPNNVSKHHHLCLSIERQSHFLVSCYL